jgi:hypothetical protein
VNEKEIAAIKKRISEIKDLQREINGDPLTWKKVKELEDMVVADNFSYEEAMRSLSHSVAMSWHNAISGVSPLTRERLQGSYRGSLASENLLLAVISSVEVRTVPLEIGSGMTDRHFIYCNTVSKDDRLIMNSHAVGEILDFEFVGPERNYSAKVIIKSWADSQIELKVTGPLNIA